VDAHAEWNGSANDGMGSGVLQVNRWKGSNKTYSSLVELRKTSLEKNLEEFIGRSEQLQSFIRIDSKNAGIIQRVSGYLFQALPGASADDADAVLEIMRNKDADLLTAHPDQSDLRAAIPGRVLRTGQFHLFCDCSREKIQQALISMGRESLEELTIEQGFIEVHCEFCRKRYEFTGKDIEDLFIT
jgi:molecular chaperone Hsp33